MKRRNPGLKLALLLLLAALPVSIEAQAGARDGENNGDFFVRLHVGAGDGKFENEPIAGGSNLEYSGTPLSLNLQVGGSIVIPDLALYGGISFITENDANVNTDELTVDPNAFEGEGRPFITHNGGYSLYMLVVGISYRVAPYNFYVSPEYRLAGRATISLDTERSTSNPGIYLENEYDYKSGRGLGLTVGKEWWFSPEWGLGVAMTYYQDTFDGDDFGTVDVGSNLPLPPARGINRFIGVGVSTTYYW